MKQIVFGSWEKPADTAWTQWILLWQSVYNPTWKPTDKSQWRAASQLLEGMDSVVVKEKTAQGEQSSLKKEGATLALEEAAFDLLKTAWELFKSTMPLGAAKDVASVESLLDSANTIKLNA